MESHYQAMLRSSCTNLSGWHLFMSICTKSSANDLQELGQALKQDVIQSRNHLLLFIKLIRTMGKLLQLSDKREYLLYDLAGKTVYKHRILKEFRLQIEYLQHYTNSARNFQISKIYFVNYLCSHFRGLDQDQERDLFCPIIAHGTFNTKLHIP